MHPVPLVIRERRLHTFKLQNFSLDQSRIARFLMEQFAMSVQPFDKLKPLTLRTCE